MSWSGRSPKTLRSVRAELIGDSIERRKLVDKLVELVRKDERDRVLRVTSKTREFMRDR